MTNLSRLTIKKTHQLLNEGKISAIGLVDYYLERLGGIDTKLRSHLTICEKSAREQAEKVDAKLARGEKVGLLEGVPYTAKDMFLTAGVRTTAASRILDNFIAPYSATVIEKLTEAGAILLAKVNQDEFAHGGSTENSAYHLTRNPWDGERVPGGSSGGSAAAVAADIGVFSLGTDTGGSIRQPASFCGVVGVKPTYGLVSRYGVVAMASSLDVIGPLARTVEDAAIVLETIVGWDERDSTTIKSDKIAYVKALNTPIEPMKIGVVKEYIDSLDAANRQAFETAADVLRQSGHETSEVSLKSVELALPCYYILTPSEISSNLERYDGVRYGQSAKSARNLEQTYTKTRDEFFGPEVKRRILTGTYTLSAGYYDAYYKQAMKVRTLICRDFEAAFTRFDALIGPTTPTPAFKLGTKTDPVEMYLADIMTAAVNLAGIPAISLPSGMVDSLPVGLQVMAAQGQETKMFNLAASYEARVQLPMAEVLK